MSKEVVERMKANLPGFLSMLGGEPVDFESNPARMTMTFDVSKDFCHSVDVIQGGFVTAMLDATMAHAVFASESGISRFSSLEIKVVFMAPARAGKLRCVGKIDRMGRSIAFLSGELYSEAGDLLCTATSTGKISRSE